MKKSPRRHTLIIVPCEPISFSNKLMINHVLSDGGKVCIGIKDDSSLHSPLEIMGKTMDEYEDLIKLKMVSVMVVPNITSSLLLGSDVSAFTSLTMC